jgi:hypothetical protein
MNHPQLPLGLALRDSARFDGFFPGPNREAIDSLRLAAAGQGESLVYVAGPAGCCRPPAIMQPATGVPAPTCPCSSCSN